MGPSPKSVQEFLQRYPHLKVSYHNLHFFIKHLIIKGSDEAVHPSIDNM